MKKGYFFLVLLCILSSTVSYSQYATVQWQQVYDTARALPIESVSPVYIYNTHKLLKLDDGSMVFVADFNNDIALYKVDASGNTVWRKVFGGTGVETSYAIKLATDGGFVIAGQTSSKDGLFTGFHGTSFADAFVAKTNMSGDPEWVRLIGGTSQDVFTSIEVLSDGYAAVGHTQSTDGDITVNNGYYDVLVSRLSLNGDVIWNKTFGSTNCDRAYTSLVNKNEEIIIGGLYIASPGCLFTFPLKKLCFAIDKNGTQLWRNDAITLPASEVGSITNLTFNADSSTFCSIVKKAIDQQPWLYKFNSSTGTVISSTQLSIPVGSDFGATAIYRTTDNHYLLSLASPVYVVGSIVSKKTYLAEIDNDGALLSLNQFDFGNEIIVDVQKRGAQCVLFSNNNQHSRLAIYQPGIFINSLTPSSGPIGTVVTIKGKGFGSSVSDNIVYFGAAKATVIAVTDTTLVVSAPAGSTYEPVTVTANGLTAYANQRFLITFAGWPLLTDSSLAAATNFPVGVSPLCVAIADLDGDGRSDLAVPNSTSATVSILRNTSEPGVISFDPKTDIVTGNNPFYVVLEDLNGDGKKDMIIACADDDKIWVYKNNSIPGSISFEAAQLYTTGDYPVSLAAGDLNSDGKPDIVVANRFNSFVSVFRNIGLDGAIVLDVKADFNTGNQVNSVSITDFNRDGKPDIAVANETSSNVSVLQNTSTESFAFVKTDYPVNLLTSVVYTGDVDSDGKDDLLGGGLVGDFPISVYRNTSLNGTTSFAQKLDVLFPSKCYNLVMGGLSGDTKPDFAIASFVENNYIISENKTSNGTIVFGPKIAYSASSSSSGIAIGDIDGDGKPDLVAANAHTQNVSVLRNRTGEASLIPSGANPVTGNVYNKVTIDSAVQTYQGHPYVQRHYDIIPVNNPAAATATIMLYFSQEDFDSYNAHPAHGLDLPHSATDDGNKANLRVYQYHGFSTTSQPGTYSGSGVEIDPDDSKIVWNSHTALWEITFDVNGFSGFFLSSVNASSLPVTLLSFKGTLQDKETVLQWKTTDEINVSYFELQRRTDSTEFSTITKTKAINNNSSTHDYAYTDRVDAAVTYSYRLKMVDIDGAFTYSKTIRVVPPTSHVSLAISPNPATDYVIVAHPAAIYQATISIIDMTGRIMKNVNVAHNVTQTKLVVKGMKPGTYNIVWKGNGTTMSQLLLIP